MTAPARSHGYTAAERQRKCDGKRRWADELTARAAGLHSLEAYGNAPELYTYQCDICHGWHLTRRRKPGQEPIKRAQQEVQGASDGRV